MSCRHPGRATPARWQQDRPIIGVQHSDPRFPGFYLDDKMLPLHPLSSVPLTRVICV